MFADTLLGLERAHLARLFAWAIASAFWGSAILAVVTVRRAAESLPLLRHFAIQMAAWGAINLAIALWAQRGLRLRDYAGARSLDRILWLNLGLDAGYVAVGVTLAVAGWVIGRRLGAVGAGVGVIVQGVALFVLDLVFVRQLGSAV